MEKQTKHERQFLNRSNIFALPIEQAVFVPSTTHGDHRISVHRQNERVQNVERFMSKKYGGFTAIQGSGGFYSKEKHKIIQEPITVVESFATRHAYNRNLPGLHKKLGQWRRNWGQESMGYELKGHLYYLSKMQKGKKK